MLKNHLFGVKKVKAQGHNVCVGLQTDRNIAAYAACCSRKPRWVFPAVMPRRTELFLRHM